jgi:hypothetical protein
MLELELSSKKSFEKMEIHTVEFTTPNEEVRIQRHTSNQ